MKVTKIFSYLLLGGLLSGLIGCAQKVERADGYYAPLGASANPYPVENSYFNYDTAPNSYVTKSSGKKRKAKSSSSKATKSSNRLTKSSLSSNAVYHTVKPGENLYRIALRYGVSQAAIRSANGLGSNSIRVGQKLRIPGARSSNDPEEVAPPTRKIAGVAAAPSSKVIANSSFSSTCSPAPRWGWPSQGVVVQIAANIAKGTAIKITGGAQALKAAAAGTITFIGRGTNRVNRIVVNHNTSFSTVYEYDGKPTAKMGDNVKLGTIIGQLNPQTSLYFEIRCHKKALNPLTYLPTS